MNKIVFEHYPASKLPQDIRGELPGDALVRIVIEADDDAIIGPLSPLARLERNAVQSSNLEKLLDRQKADPALFSGSVSTEDAVSRIRELRDEWDDK